MFVLFSIPAIVMATDWCEDQSNNSELHGTASCDTVAPMFLSLRTLATVSVYFCDPQCRAELLDRATLRRKVWLRLCGCGRWCCGTAAGDLDAAGYRVHFLTDLEEMNVFDRDVAVADDVAGEETGAGIPYEAMA